METVFFDDTHGGFDVDILQEEPDALDEDDPALAGHPAASEEHPMTPEEMEILVQAISADLDERGL